MIGTQALRPGFQFKLGAGRNIPGSTSAFVSLRPDPPAGRRTDCSALRSGQGAAVSHDQLLRRHPPTGAVSCRDVERQDVHPSASPPRHATMFEVGSRGRFRAGFPFFEAANVATGTTVSHHDLLGEKYGPQARAWKLPCCMLRSRFEASNGFRKACQLGRGNATQGKTCSTPATPPTKNIFAVSAVLRGCGFGRALYGFAAGSRCRHRRANDFTPSGLNEAAAGDHSVYLGSNSKGFYKQDSQTAKSPVRFLPPELQLVFGHSARNSPKRFQADRNPHLALCHFTGAKPLSNSAAVGSNQSVGWPRWWR